MAVVGKLKPDLITDAETCKREGYLWDRLHNKCLDFEPCVVKCMGREIHGMKPKEEDVCYLYHRTEIDNLKKIAKEGEIKPSSETHVVSLSSNPDHTFGGVVRLVVDKEGVDAKPMCYFPFNEENLKNSSDAEREYREKINKRAMPNEFYAYCGISPDVYAGESEFMSKKPVKSNKIKKVEYWLSNPIHNVSCENCYPPYLSYDVWSGKEFSQVKEEIKETKEIAEDINADFEVKSCFKYMSVPCRSIGEGNYDVCDVELNKENLKRLGRLENPVPFHKGYSSELSRRSEVDKDTKNWCRC